MSLCENSELLSIIGILKTVLKIMQIGIPVLLIIFGTIDLGKAVMAGDEKEIKAATSILVKRAIAAVAVMAGLILLGIYLTGKGGIRIETSIWEPSEEEKE